MADVVGPGLRVLFCGVNPGLRSAELGQHFARPGNRFWKVLHAAGFTDRVLAPGEQGLLPAFGLGITNLVDRPTAGAAELTVAQLREGAARLVVKAADLRPGVVAVLGVVAYRKAFTRPRAVMGAQQDRLGDAAMWVLPNPSGLQARYQLAEMTELFAGLRRAAGMRPAHAGARA